MSRKAGCAEVDRILLVAGLERCAVARLVSQALECVDERSDCWNLGLHRPIGPVFWPPPLVEDFCSPGYTVVDISRWAHHRVAGAPDIREQALQVGSRHLQVSVFATIG